MCAISCVIAYLICGIPSAYILGRRVAHVDVRTVGSGNVGSTNLSRVAGSGTGVLGLLFDVLKAVVSMLIGYLLIGFVGTGAGFEMVRPGGVYDWTMALVYLFCILGHVFTPYLRFKGGKGIAVGFGGGVGLWPPFGFSLWIPFLLFAGITRYISVGSIAAAVSLPFLFWLICRPSLPAVIITCVLAAVVVWAHRKNIVKLARGEESKFSFSRKKKDTEGE